ncbi:MAG: sigma-54-dependent Fis family transcriptional regulator [Burkholderiaceae bacterium]|nr:sigma-54-dependent Fis family transcriptional regulator [Burkholderiaceae bacterium]
MTSLTSTAMPTNAPMTNIELSPALQQSWQRCQDMASALHTDPSPLITADLNNRREQYAHFLKVAQPELKTLTTLVSSAHSVVLLADASGVILQQAGSTDFLRKAEEVALQPGVSWAESIRGTNAIGTALLAGAPVRVHGSEHFLERNHVLSCHAAPVFSPRGDIMGVLDISSEASVLHDYALGLAKMCAKKISNRLLETAPENLRQLVFQRKLPLLDSDERAIILLDDERIVGANSAALHLLGTDWSLLDTSINHWLENGATASDNASQLRLRNGQPVLGRMRQTSARPHVMVAPVTNKRSAPSPVPAPTPHNTLPTLTSVALTQLPQGISALNGGLSVMLLGETGAGKEIFARHLHQNSHWRDGPFVAINCGALPESLIESELFGYEAGAFTGARREGARGRLREADGGILFLDEIGDMPLLLQTRLLRALQEREVQPLGSDKRIAVNLAVVSATNRDLTTMINEGSFRSDLYYRLQDYKIPLQPLRQHAQLRTFLCTEFRRLGGDSQGMTLDDSALQTLSSWHWPGNYRELHSVLRTLLCLLPPGSLVQASDLPAEITRLHTPQVMNERIAPPNLTPNSLHALNQQAIQQALAECGNNISQAARLLGVHRSTLYRHKARQS